MKEIIEYQSIIEKEVFYIEGKKAATVLSVWDDNCITDAYMGDTFGIAIKKCYLTKNNRINDNFDDIEFYGVWLTKEQCIILKSYLELFIQFAETENELETKGVKE